MEDSCLKKLEEGASQLTLIFFGLLSTITLYLTAQIAPVLYRYYELESQAEAMARRAMIVSDDEILRRLSEIIVKHNLPADPGDIRIYRAPNEMEITLDYESPITIPWIDGEWEIYTFQFHLKVHERISLERPRY
ncbi:MAG: hypothetical protein ACO3XO_01790 [Bdellovibrionota bacterium]|jgi:hypothetical protein